MSPGGPGTASRRTFTGFPTYFSGIDLRFLRPTGRLLPLLTVMSQSITKPGARHFLTAKETIRFTQ